MQRGQRAPLIPGRQTTLLHLLLRQPTGKDIDRKVLQRIYSQVQVSSQKERDQIRRLCSETSNVCLRTRFAAGRRILAESGHYLRIPLLNSQVRTTNPVCIVSSIIQTSPLSPSNLSSISCSFLPPPSSTCSSAN